MIGVIEIGLQNTDFILELFKIHKGKIILINDLRNSIRAPANQLHSLIVLLEQMRRADEDDIHIRILLAAIGKKAAECLLIKWIQISSFIKLFNVRGQLAQLHPSCDGLKAAERGNALVVRTKVEVIPDGSHSPLNAAGLIGMILIEGNEETKCTAPIAGIFQIGGDKFCAGRGEKRQMKRHALHRSLIHVIFILIRGTVQSPVYLDHHSIRILPAHGLVQLSLPYLYGISVDGERITGDAVFLISQTAAVGTADIAGSDQDNIQGVFRLLVEADDTVFIVIPMDVESIPRQKQHEYKGCQKRQELARANDPHSEKAVRTAGGGLDHSMRGGQPPITVSHAGKHKWHIRQKRTCLFSFQAGIRTMQFCPSCS
jgi:hypothetical protein